MGFNGTEPISNMVHRKGRKRRRNLIWNLLLCQVRISARAASLNFPELLMMQNKWPENHDSDCCNPLWTPIRLCYMMQNIGSSVGNVSWGFMCGTSFEVPVQTQVALRAVHRRLPQMLMSMFAHDSHLPFFWYVSFGVISLLFKSHDQVLVLWLRLDPRWGRSTERIWRLKYFDKRHLETSRGMWDHGSYRLLSWDDHETDDVMILRNNIIMA